MHCFVNAKLSLAKSAFDHDFVATLRQRKYCIKKYWGFLSGSKTLLQKELSKAFKKKFINLKERCSLLALTFWGRMPILSYLEKLIKPKAAFFRRVQLSYSLGLHCKFSSVTSPSKQFCLFCHCKERQVHIFPVEF